MPHEKHGSPFFLNRWHVFVNVSMKVNLIIRKKRGVLDVIMGCDHQHGPRTHDAHTQLYIHLLLHVLLIEYIKLSLKTFSQHNIFPFTQEWFHIFWSCPVRGAYWKFIQQTVETTWKSRVFLISGVSLSTCNVIHEKTGTLTETNLS